MGVLHTAIVVADRLAPIAIRIAERVRRTRQAGAAAALAAREEWRRRAREEAERALREQRDRRRFL